MMSALLPLARFQASDSTRDRNEQRIKDDSEPCVLCGRGTSGAHWIHMSTDCDLVAIDATLPENEDQGWFTIGPECAKKIPAGFVSPEPL